MNLISEKEYEAIMVLRDVTILIYNELIENNDYEYDLLKRLYHNMLEISQEAMDATGWPYEK